MNAGLLVFILLLALSFLGIPIFVALGIGTLVALNMADLPLLVLPQKLFAGMNSTPLPCWLSPFSSWRATSCPAASPVSSSTWPTR